MGEITDLMEATRVGSVDARERLFVCISSELRSVAERLMTNERIGHTLQPTALINEACARLIDAEVIKKAADRRYLLGAAIRSMRQILIDHARRRSARPESATREPLDSCIHSIEESSSCEFAQLTAALDRLSMESSRQCEVVELRFFGCLSIAEIASALDVSRGTVERDWRIARAKLRTYLDKYDDDEF